MSTFKIILLTIIFTAAIGLVGVRVSTADGNKENVNTNQINELPKQEVNKLASVNFLNQGNMVASWYGPKFHGKQTANTEIFNQMAYTAAHKTLPFGTMLRLTNPSNGRTVVVRINDRGPYITGRDIDLSKKAAIELGMIQRGVIKVNVEKIVPELEGI